MIAGITGVFSSGKTTIAKIFGEHGYKVINADKTAHKLLLTEPIKNRLVKEFGKSILSKNRIDRRKLKNIVFYNYKELVKLNKLMHPLIIKDIGSIIRMSKSKKIVIDGALLAEAKSLNLLDKLIVVKISRKEQMKRALKRGKYSRKEIRNILGSQLSQREKLKYADYVIDNSFSLKETIKSAEGVINKLERQAGENSLNKGCKAEVK